MTNDSEFSDLEAFTLNDDEWKTLKDYSKILKV